MVVGSYYRKRFQSGMSGMIEEIWSEKQVKPYIQGVVNIYKDNGQNPRYHDYSGSKGLAWVYCDHNAPWTNCADESLRKARARLSRKAISEHAGLGVSLSQSGLAWTMIASRLRQVATSVSRLKKGNIPGAISALNPFQRVVKDIERTGYTAHAWSNAISLTRVEPRGMTLSRWRKLSYEKQVEWFHNATVKRLKRSAKNASGLWLELTFGWRPLLVDVQRSMAVLSQEFPTERVKASAKTSYVARDPRGGAIGDVIDVALGVTARVSADVEITNPNLLLANQLGVINPAAVAWDLVPFSFVVDWFVPVSRFINSWTADAGLNYKDPCYSLRHRVHVDYFSYYYNRKSFTDATRFQRKRGLPDGERLPGSAKLPEPTRWLAGTSCALIIQHLKTFR